MLSVAVSVGDVVTDICTDQQMSFEGIATLLKRATDATLEAYGRYIISEEDSESTQEYD